MRLETTRESELALRSSDELAEQPRLASSERSREAALAGFPSGGSGGSGSAQAAALRVTDVAIPDVLQDAARVSV
jgi:hypothetical protein